MLILRPDMPVGRPDGFDVCRIGVIFGRAVEGVHGPVWGGERGDLEDWLANGRGEPGTLDLFPSERGGLVVESTLLRRVRRYCQELGVSDGLDLHSLRRSYATHLLEAGWDPRFVQDQMGHEHASTTGIYQFVSDEFRRSTLRSALDRTVTEAMQRKTEDGTS